MLGLQVVSYTCRTAKDLNPSWKIQPQMANSFILLCRMANFLLFSGKKEKKNKRKNPLLLDKSLLLQFIKAELGNRMIKAKTVLILNQQNCKDTVLKMLLFGIPTAGTQQLPFLLQNTQKV